MVMDKKQVMEFLPHRDPFLFIDTVKEIILPEAIRGKPGPFTVKELVGGKVICTFKLEASEKILAGHFPGDPILPGVVQVEMMAQSSSFLTLYSLDRPYQECRLEVVLVGVDAARFKRPVVPPMDLEIHATFTKVRGPIQMFDCELYSGGELMSQTSIMASLKVVYK